MRKGHEGQLEVSVRFNDGTAQLDTGTPFKFRITGELWPREIKFLVGLAELVKDLGATFEPAETNGNAAAERVGALEDVGF